MPRLGTWESFLVAGNLPLAAMSKKGQTRPQTADGQYGQFGTGAGVGVNCSCSTRVRHGRNFWKVAEDPRAMLVTEIGGARPPNEIVLD